MRSVVTVVPLSVIFLVSACSGGPQEMLLEGAEVSTTVPVGDGSAPAPEVGGRPTSTPSRITAPAWSQETATVTAPSPVSTPDDEGVGGAVGRGRRGPEPATTPTSQRPTEPSSTTTSEARSSTRPDGPGGSDGDDRRVPGASQSGGGTPVGPVAPTRGPVVPTPDFSGAGGSGDGEGSGEGPSGIDRAPEEEVEAADPCPDEPADRVGAGASRANPGDLYPDRRDRKSRDREAELGCSIGYTHWNVRAGGSRMVGTGADRRLVVSVELFNRRRVVNQALAEQFELFSLDGDTEHDPRTFDDLTTLRVDVIVPSGGRVSGDIAFDVGDDPEDAYYLVHSPTLFSNAPGWLNLDTSRGVWRLEPGEFAER